MESKALRRYYKLQQDQTGVLVLEVSPLAPAARVLQRGDVLLALDSIRIANDGTIPFRKGSLKERVQLSYYITQKFSDETINVSVLRNGQRMDIPGIRC